MNELPNEEQPIRPERIEYPVSPHLRRIRYMSRLLDTSIKLPTGHRIGIDPIIGLIPGIGDFIGAVLSLYIVYEAARMGIEKRILIRMLVNVLIEVLVGEIPILGDIFDAVWKANIRNAKLVEMNYQPTQMERPAGKIGFYFAILLLVFFVIIALATIGVIWLLIYLMKSASIKLW